MFCYSVAKLCPTLWDPMNWSTPGFPVLHYFPEFAQIHVHWVGNANYLILCHPFLLLPSIFPSIKVFSSESALHIRWSKYWSFSFSIRPSNEYSRLISFRIDSLQRSFDFFAVQGIFKSLLQHHKAKESILQCSAFFITIKESIYNDKRVNSPGKY